MDILLVKDKKVWFGYFWINSPNWLIDKSVILLYWKFNLINLSSGSFFKNSQKSVSATLLIQFLLKFNFLIVLLYIPSSVLLFKEWAISKIPLYIILLWLKFNVINDLFFFKPLDKMEHPSSPKKLLFKFNFFKVQFEFSNKSEIIFIPSKEILLLLKFNFSFGRNWILERLK